MIRDCALGPLEASALIATSPRKDERRRCNPEKITYWTTFFLQALTAEFDTRVDTPKPAVLGGKST